MGILGGQEKCWLSVGSEMKTTKTLGIETRMYPGLVPTQVPLCAYIAYSCFCLTLLRGTRGIKKDFTELLSERHKKPHKQWPMKTVWCGNLKVLVMVIGLSEVQFRE